MENVEILNKLNTALNILDSLRAEIINQDKKPKTKTKNSFKLKDIKVDLDTASEQELSVDELNAYMKILSSYGLPMDSDFIKNIDKIIKSEGINADDFSKTLANIKRANEKEPKEDIKKYTYGCLHNIKKY